MTPTQPTFTGEIEILPNGTVKMYTNPTVDPATKNAGSGDYKIYQRTGKDWLLTCYKHQVALESIGQQVWVWWMEEWFGGSYEYEQTISGKDPYFPSGTVSDTKVQDGKATTIFYKNALWQLVKGYGAKHVIPYMWDNKQQGPVPAQVTYVHSVVDGKLGKMLEFRLTASDGDDYDNNWTDDGSKLGHWDIASGGWPYNTDNEGELSRPADPGVTYKPPRDDPSIYQIGYPLKSDTNAEIVADFDLPFKNRTAGPQSYFVETIWDNERTHAIRFVYAKEDMKDLIQQSIGHMENGEWVWLPF